LSPSFGDSVYQYPFDDDDFADDDHCGRKLLDVSDDICDDNSEDDSVLPDSIPFVSVAGESWVHKQWILCTTGHYLVSDDDDSDSDDDIPVHSDNDTDSDDDDDMAVDGQYVPGLTEEVQLFYDMEECLIDTEATVDAEVINDEGWSNEHRVENSMMAIVKATSQTSRTQKIGFRLLETRSTSIRSTTTISRMPSTLRLRLHLPMPTAFPLQWISLNRHYPSAVLRLRLLRYHS
jgi:hypothetical protein